MNTRTIKGTCLHRLAFLCTAFVALASICAAHPIEQTVRISCANRFSGGERSLCKVGVGEKHTEAIVINIVSSNTGLVLPAVNEVTLAPSQEGVEVPLKTFSTPIKSTVTITASLKANTAIQAQETIEVVPALIAYANLSVPSFIGTHGAKTICTVKLKAPAPTGGIQIYLSPLQPSQSIPKGTLSLHIQNPTVLAGTDLVNFDIAFDKIYLDEVQISEGDPSSADSGVANAFNAQTRSLTLVVALDPQPTKVWTTISGTANAVKFDVIPLRITSVSVQPSTLSNGAEALGSFTLNAAPGNNEVVIIHPRRSATSKVWAALLGTSCVAPTSGPVNLELPLVAGTTNYSFKVCSAPVNSSTAGTLSLFLRGGTSQTSVTVQP